MSYPSLHPHSTLYPNDGLGRDTYISYNNGGLWKENIAYIFPKPNYRPYKDKRFYSLIHQAAPFTYYSDGSGRDSYVLRYNGLTRSFEPQNKFKFHEILRTPDRIFNYRSNPFEERRISKAELLSKAKTRKVEKDLIYRLYTSEKDKFIPYDKMNHPKQTQYNNKDNKIWKCYYKQAKNTPTKTISLYPTMPNLTNKKSQTFYREGKLKVRVMLNEI